MPAVGEIKMGAMAAPLKLCWRGRPTEWQQHPWNQMWNLEIDTKVSEKYYGIKVGFKIWGKRHSFRAVR